MLLNNPTQISRSRFDMSRAFSNVAWCDISPFKAFRPLRSYRRRSKLRKKHSFTAPANHHGRHGLVNNNSIALLNLRPKASACGMLKLAVLEFAEKVLLVEAGQEVVDIFYPSRRCVDEHGRR